MRKPSYSAEAEQATAAAHDVQKRDLLGHAHGIVPRQHDHRGAELDAPGAAGEVGEQLRRRGRHGVAGEVMLERPQRIEAQRLDEIAELEMLLHHGNVWLVVLVEHVHRDADFHGFLR